MARRRKTNLTRVERDRLVRFYRSAISRIHELVMVDGIEAWERPRLGKILSESTRVLRELDDQVDKWIAKEFKPLYRGNLSWIDKWMKQQGLLRLSRTGGSGEQWAVLHERVVDDLILRPEVGLGPRLKRASAQLGQSVRQYVSQHKALLGQVRLLNEEMAFGVLTGQTTIETTRAVTQAFQNKRPRSFFGFQREGNPYKTLLDAPYIQIPTKRGSRRLHVEDYVRQVVVTKESEMQAEATKRRSLERGIRLVQVSPNPSLVGDACDLYTGRVFALTPEGSKATGFPLVDRLPNGGPPFHPNSHVFGTVIDGCRVLAGSVREFVGEVVTIETARGHRTTITANHPVFTERGLLPAKSLSVGDGVFRGLDGGGLSFGVDVEHRPAHVEDLPSLLHDNGQAVRLEVPVRAEHFYGEGLDGQVVVVTADRELVDRLQSEFSEVPAEADLVVASGGSLLGLRLLGEGCGGVGGPDSRLDSLPSLLLGSLGMVGVEPLGAAPELDPGAFESPDDGGAVNLEPLSHLRGAYPGSVEPDEVVRVDVRPFTGQVGCLQSESGVYAADGLMVRNCTHGLIPFVEEAFEPEEVEAMKENGDDGVRTSGGTPVVGLDKDYQKVEKEFRKRGGTEWAAKQNPLLNADEASQFTDPRAIRAIRSRGAKREAQ